MTDLAVPVRKSVTVEIPIERAFAVFTDKTNEWWPRGHHIGSAEIDRVVMESHAGGRWYEIGVDGSQCDWGRVVEWEPPGRVVLRWQIDSTWQYNANLETTVEVTFSALGPESTRVDVEHRDLDQFGEAEEEMRGQFNSQGGWQGLLDLFVATAHAQ